MKRIFLFLLCASIIMSGIAGAVFAILFLHIPLFDTQTAGFAAIFVNNTVLGIVLAGIFFLITGFILIKPLKTFSKALTAASEGTDLTQKLSFRGDRYIKDITGPFNRFTEKLSETLNKLKTKVDRSTEIGETVETAARKTAALSREVEVSIDRNKDMISSLGGEIACALAGVKNVQVLVAALTEKIVQEQAAAIDQSSAGVEEMVASINSITRVTRDKKKLTDNVRGLTQKGSKDMNKTIDSISAVSRSAASIMDSIKDINDVAERINLLAMNAAIEAAHAGEAGKGFAVVAAEVKKLAETTNINVRTITDSLTAMIKQMEDAVVISRQTVDSIRNIEAAAESVAGGMEEINGGVSEVSMGGVEILKVLGTLKEITKTVKDASSESDAKMEDAAKSIDVIANLSAGNLENAATMKNLVQEISLSIEGLLEQGRRRGQ